MGRFTVLFSARHTPRKAFRGTAACDPSACPGSLVIPEVRGSDCTPDNGKHGQSDERCG
jgi:hypothetical protein